MNEKREHPSREKCLRILEEYKTPPHVISHCKAVAEAALKIAEALNRKGYNLDTGLVFGAAMLHDIARVEENHQEVGADIVFDLGYEEEADIIRRHMKYTTDPKENKIDETDIVCIADKMIMEDKYVGINDRMEAIIKKFSHVKDVETRIRKKLVENKAFVTKVEGIIGMSIDDLMLE